MRKSRVVEVEGVFVGTAIDVEGGYRFIPVDGRLRSLAECVCPTLADIQRLARSLLQRTSSAAAAAA
jgi:hypothetical protein